MPKLEFEKKLSELQSKNEKEVKYIRQVSNMQKITLERRITALEKDLKEKEEKLNDKEGALVRQQTAMAQTKDEEQTNIEFENKINELQKKSQKEVNYIR